MTLRFRKAIRFGAIRLNVSRRGVSPSIRVGSVTRSLRSGRTSANLPGPFTWISGRRRR